MAECVPFHLLWESQFPNTATVVIDARPAQGEEWDVSLEADPTLVEVLTSLPGTRRYSFITLKSGRGWLTVTATKTRNDVAIASRTKHYWLYVGDGQQ